MVCVGGVFSGVLQCTRVFPTARPYLRIMSMFTPLSSKNTRLLCCAFKFSSFHLIRFACTSGTLLFCCGKTDFLHAESQRTNHSAHRLNTNLQSKLCAELFQSNSRIFCDTLSYPCFIFAVQQSFSTTSICLQLNAASLPLTFLQMINGVLAYMKNFPDLFRVMCRFVTFY